MGIDSTTFRFLQWLMPWRPCTVICVFFWLNINYRQIKSTQLMFCTSRSQLRAAKNKLFTQSRDDSARKINNFATAKGGRDEHGSGREIEMSTAPRPRSPRCGFGNFFRVPAAPRDIEKCYAAPAPRTALTFIKWWTFAKRTDFSEVIVSDNNSCFLVYPTAFTCVFAMPLGEDS